MRQLIDYLGGPPSTTVRTTRSMLGGGDLWVGSSSETRIPEEGPPSSTGLRATERVSRELTTALGKQAARATVGVLG
jgi:hypothetical protein